MKNTAALGRVGSAVWDLAEIALLGRNRRAAKNAEEAIWQLIEVKLPTPSEAMASFKALHGRPVTSAERDIIRVALGAMSAALRGEC